MSELPSSADQKYHLRVLVIDDDTMQLDYLSILLRSVGIQDIICAEDANLAVTHLDSLEKPIHLIICDLVMPTMDGFDFLWELAKRASQIPLIIVSAQAQEVRHSAALVAQLKSLNLIGELEKPIDRDQFFALIQTQIG
ncbi:response regulator [Undibacterium fentianense]|uniref:Response regulator n=1 Tax=Undibacterium fentianense TaxID=2828728 RepID=A0A941ID39_9BURK|nr:response regulator [Undibacterium fentianense]MBR7799548.1 response regulator [Undibacterium fentianense]